MKNLVGHLKSILGFSKRQTESHLSFQATFNRFREVLDNNNRALEIITDMGEKLGGDYLFDINYIKNAYSALSTAVYNSIQNFDALTRNRYLQLHEIFERIDKQIKRVIYDVAPASGEMIIPYDSISWDMYHEVGGKNANLAELKNYLKVSVPEAFAITTHAFDEFIKHNRLNVKIGTLNEDITESILNEWHDLVINAEIPPALDIAIDNAIEKFRRTCRGNCFLAVRSSAEEEDSEFSFAGQFETFLNVPLEGKAVKEAYKKVVASMFSDKAVAYQRQLGYDIRNIKMAAACMLMVDAAVSGVMYSINPHGDSDTLIINSTWGLGTSVVEGRTDADFYLVKKDKTPEIVDKKIGKKTSLIVCRNEGGISTNATPAEQVGKDSLTDAQVRELAVQAMQIERLFRKPQDIEWAISKAGKVFILQARPLRIAENKAPNIRPPLPPLANSNVLMKAGGIVVQKGAGAGRVFILKHMDELENFPKGAILVAKHDSSNFIKVMPYVSAIITDVGTPTSHMASICREFRVPTIVNAGNATQIFEHGQEITVNADDDGNVTIYDGIIKELLEHAGSSFRRMEDVYEFRRKRYILRYISPLNLIDPLLEDFTPEGCKTMHDILRFIHEKSVAELVDKARYGSAMLKKHAAVKLDLPIPTGIIVIDIGGGLSFDGKTDKASFEQITSAPLRAIIKGMTYPGVWHSDAIALKVNDFLTSMIRMSDIVSDSSEYVGYNVAVVSREYVNLSLRFGYHFNMLDCYCSENARNNHIYFRFVGGATDIVKRSRRVELIAAILREYGFNLKTKGDLMIARLANLRQDEMVNILDQLGRLIAYTRQLDAMLHDDNAVERYARKFIEGNYEL